ncbi:MAG: hypothetical protein KA155_01530 [Alphaproteobacteria bacterium]|jgi:hypothetical protein|nr:hypothetical protein [Alphaproteobacteria bacterium]
MSNLPCLNSVINEHDLKRLTIEAVEKILCLCSPTQQMSDELRERFCSSMREAGYNDTVIQPAMLYRYELEKIINEIRKKWPYHSVINFENNQLIKQELCLAGHKEYFVERAMFMWLRDENMKHEKKQLDTVWN